MEKRRVDFNIAVNSNVVYSDIGEPIMLYNYLNTSLPYGQKQKNYFKKEFNSAFRGTI